MNLLVWTYLKTVILFKVHFWLPMSRDQFCCSHEEYPGWKRFYGMYSHKYSSLERILSACNQAVQHTCHYWPIFMAGEWKLVAIFYSANNIHSLKLLFMCGFAVFCRRVKYVACRFIPANAATCPLKLTFLLQADYNDLCLEWWLCVCGDCCAHLRWWWWWYTAGVCQLPAHRGRTQVHRWWNHRQGRQLQTKWTLPRSQLLSQGELCKYSQPRHVIRPFS